MDLVSSYTYKKKGPRKDPSFYKNLSDLFISDPVKAKKIIDILPKIGYYKDFLYLLEASLDNKDLQDYIYDRILFIIKHKWPSGKCIILSKWMPRENSSFDRKLNFVDYFSKRLFPDEKLNHRRKRYRKLIAETCKQINTIESNLCAKTYDNIDKLTNNNLKTYQKTIYRNPELKSKVKEIFTEQYSKNNSDSLIRLYDMKYCAKIRKPIIESLVKTKANNDIYSPDKLLILDISSSMFNNYIAKVYSRMICYSVNHTELIINSRYPKLVSLNGMLSIKDAKNIVCSTLDVNLKLDFQKIKSMVKPKYNSYSIVCDKDISINDTKVNLDILNSNFVRKNRLKETEILRRILNRRRKRYTVKWILIFVLLIWLKIYHLW